jgi:hypothetical protein
MHAPFNLFKACRRDCGCGSWRLGSRTRSGQGGDYVWIGECPFVGLEAVVISTLPARARVRVLMEFLGRKIEADCQCSLIEQGAGMWDPNQVLRNPLLA